MTQTPLIETEVEDRQTRARHFASNARSQPKGTWDTCLRPPLVSIRGSQTSLGLDGAADASAGASVGTSPIHWFHQIGWWVLLRCGRAQKMMPSTVRTTKKPCRVAELLTGLATISVALTRLSLVGLHPCRAQLRFPEQLQYSYEPGNKIPRPIRMAETIMTAPLTHNLAPSSLTALPDRRVDLVRETASPSPENGTASCAELDCQKRPDEAKTGKPDHRLWRPHTGLGRTIMPQMTAANLTPDEPPLY